MSRRPSGDRGQASLIMLAVVAVLLAGALVLLAFGQALGAGPPQRAADLAAISAGRRCAISIRACSSRRSSSPACRTRGTSTRPATCARRGRRRGDGARRNGGGASRRAT